MLKFLATAIALTLSSPASADTCPDFFRFADFGSPDSDGVLRRGGTILRAFVDGGTPLVRFETAECRDVDILSKDGRGLLIPVVASVDIDVSVATLDLTTLRMFATDDPATTANAAAAQHRRALSLADTIQTRGPNFLCASLPDTPDTSCQILSPYDPAIPLVVYCDAQICTMPALVHGGNVALQATWPRAAISLDALGAEASDQIQTIVDFLAAQI